MQFGRAVWHGGVRAGRLHQSLFNTCVLGQVVLTHPCVFLYGSAAFVSGVSGTGQGWAGEVSFTMYTYTFQA